VGWALNNEKLLRLEAELGFEKFLHHLLNSWATNDLKFYTTMVLYNILLAQPIYHLINLLVSCTKPLIFSCVHNYVFSHTHTFLHQLLLHKSIPFVPPFLSHILCTNLINDSLHRSPPAKILFHIYPHHHSLDPYYIPFIKYVIL